MRYLVIVLNELWKFIIIFSAEIAKKLSEDSYALIFGMNMFLALVLQSILTAVVLSWLQLPPHEQVKYM
jgi:thiamine transporter 2/3